jgi:hypothetical protein
MQLSMSLGTRVRDHPFHSETILYTTCHHACSNQITPLPPMDDDGEWEQQNVQKKEDTTLTGHHKSNRGDLASNKEQDDPPKSTIQILESKKQGQESISGDGQHSRRMQSEALDVWKPGARCASWHMFWHPRMLAC